MTKFLLKTSNDIFLINSKRMICSIMHETGIVNFGKIFIKTFFVDYDIVLLRDYPEIELHYWEIYFVLLVIKVF